MSGFIRLSTKAPSNTIQINGNVGSDRFDPSKLNNWHHETDRYANRWPLISPQGSGPKKNIYAPTVVNNGVGNFNIYFGGWDGVSSPHDSVSVTNTSDTFGSFSKHYSQIETGIFQHVNNCNAIKVNDNSWVMIYTTALTTDGKENKPAYAISTNGNPWTPNSGSYDYRIAINRYPHNWNANVNGGNVIYYDPNTSIYHLYFVDFLQLNTQSVFHATSNDHVNWQYQNVALKEPNRIVNDMKKINGFYIMGLHYNTQHIWYSVSNNLQLFNHDKPVNILFSHLGADDKYITSMGFVVNSEGNRLMGALYGASVKGLTQNRVYGIWLQKKVLFLNNNVVWGIGNASRGYGPDKVIINVNKNQAIGKFYVYDSDYIDFDHPGTLLYVSPSDVTVNSGDIWKYDGTVNQNVHLSLIIQYIIRNNYNNKVIPNNIIRIISRYSVQY